MPFRKAHISLGPGVTPREHAIDAIYRFVNGLDIHDEELLRSAFTEEGVLDLSDIQRVTGKTYPELQGPDAIVNRVFAHVGSMDSGHHISNVRVRLDGQMREAEVTALAIAQHCRGGEGADASKRGCMMGMHYWADVVKTGEGEAELWKIRRMELRNLWTEGDLAVME